MGDAKLHIKQRHVDNCTRADPAYGAGVAKALGLEHRALAAAEYVAPRPIGRGSVGREREACGQPQDDGALDVR